MLKTTVYLPEDLKRSVARLAATTGRSEAELIREAVAGLVANSERPRPRGGLFASDDPMLFGKNVDDAIEGFGEN